MKKMDLRRYSKGFSGYTELRFQENRSSRVSLINGNLVGNEENSVAGFSSRAYNNGYWGFCAAPRGAAGIKDVIKKAVSNAKFMALRGRQKIGAIAGSPVNFVSDFSTKLPRRSRKQIVGFVRELDAYIAKKYKKLKSRHIQLNALEMEKQFLNSDGASFYSFLPRTTAMITLSVDTARGSADFYETWGGRGQFEEVFSRPSDFFEKLEQQYAHLLDKASGAFSEAGTKECVLAPELAGVLAHEAIGHTTEADLVLGGSVARVLRGKKVGSPLVTIVDYANTFRGKTCQTPVYIDDEGTMARDVVIIDRGVLKSYMHSKESARHFGVQPTGNARAFSFSDEPIIRMRNTAIVPGESKLEEMISSIKDGYYMMRRGNGQADLTSEFMFSVTLGYEIRNGKLGRAIKDTTVSGIAYDVLKTVSMVSDDMYWRTFGFCGKSQPMLLSMGGPAIKCRINVGGR
jgi:TldD protein